MSNEVHANIKKDPLVWKFCFYGFFKNLKFFEPFLIILFLQENLSLFQVGLLYSIREVVTYVFEIPSGILADLYGKKRELVLCFLFYIVSFVIFYFSHNFVPFGIAMAAFGLGEAFRSGSHKAMMLVYMEEKNWLSQKSFIYGRTRSFSLLGSSISSFISILFILYNHELRGLFLLTVVPYIADFLLISSYPEKLNVKLESNYSLNTIFREGKQRIVKIWKDKKILATIASSSIFDAVFKSVKDYIQPILKTLILSASAVFITSLSPKGNLRIILAIVYGFIYLLSSLSSRWVHKLIKYKSSATLMNLLFLALGVFCLLISAFIHNNFIIPIIMVFLAIFIMQSMRRPLFVDVIGDLINKRESATVLSVDSQFKSLAMALLAPICGFIADKYSIETMFLLLGIFCVFITITIPVPEVSSDN